MKQYTFIKQSKNLLVSFFLISAAATVASCSQEASSPLPPRSQGPINAGSAGSGVVSDAPKSFTQMAVTYKGSDLVESQEDCTVSLSFISDSHSDNQNSDHAGEEWVLKVERLVHGINPADSVVEFQRYQKKTGLYFPIESDEPNTVNTLVSLLLSKDIGRPDYNELKKYKFQGIFEQMVRAEWMDFDIPLFEENLELVLDDNSLFESRKNAFDRLNSVAVIINHNGHPHKLICGDFSEISLEEKTFELGKTHQH